MRKKGEETIKKPETMTAFVFPVLLGTGIAMLLLLLAALIMAGMIWGGALPASNPGMFLTVCAGICALIGSRIAIQKGSGQPIVMGAVTAAVLCIVMGGICLGSTGEMAFHAQFVGTLLMIMAGGTLAGLFGKTKRKRKR